MCSLEALTSVLVTEPGMHLNDEKHLDHGLSCSKECSRQTVPTTFGYGELLQVGPGLDRNTSLCSTALILALASQCGTLTRAKVVVLLVGVALFCFWYLLGFQTIVQYLF